jgi:hypothetical protein
VAGGERKWKRAELRPSAIQFVTATVASGVAKPLVTGLVRLNPSQVRRREILIRGSEN